MARIGRPDFLWSVNKLAQNTAQQCRLGLCQDSDFAGDLEDSKSTSGGLFCMFGSQTFVPRSWMCKRQTSVSHSSTEAEIISLGARSLGLSDCNISFFTKPNQPIQRSGVTGKLVSEHHNQARRSGSE